MSLPSYCHGCGASGRLAIVSDPFSDITYGLCVACLGKALPDAQEMIRRLELNAPGGPGWPPKDNTPA